MAKYTIKAIEDNYGDKLVAVNPENEDICLGTNSPLGGQRAIVFENIQELEDYAELKPGEYTAWKAIDYFKPGTPVYLAKKVS